MQFIKVKVDWISKPKSESWALINGKVYAVYFKDGVGHIMYDSDYPLLGSTIDITEMGKKIGTGTIIH